MSEKQSESTLEKLKRLTEDLLQARQAASRAVEGVEDTGTCNLDTLVLEVGPDASFPRKLKAILSAVEAAGCSAAWTGNRWHRGYFIFLPVFGQALRRTKTVEAACLHLRGRGWQVHVWYQID